MTNQLPPELFSQRPVRSDFTDSEPSYALRRFITIIVLLSVLAGGAYWLWGRKVTTNPQEIPTISADKNYKRRPDQPGGIDIPHQDVQVYQELDSKNSDKAEIDHLLPPPETPQITSGSTVTVPVPAVQPRVESLMPEAATAVPVDAPLPSLAQSQVAASQSMEPQATVSQTTVPSTTATPATVSANTSKIDFHEKKLIDGNPVVDNPALTNSSGPASSLGVPDAESSNKVGEADRGITLPASPANPISPALAISSKQAVKPSSSANMSLAPVSPPVMKEKKSNLTIEQVIKDTSLDKSTGRDKAIQLASVPDQAAAEQIMHKLQAKYASVLGDIQLHLVRADLGSKGIYYRVQGRVSSEQQAISICNSLRKLNSGCLLVSSR